MIKIPNQANLKFQMMTDNSLHPNNHNKKQQESAASWTPRHPLLFFISFVILMAIIRYVNIELQFLGRVAKQWISKKIQTKGF